MKNYGVQRGWFNESWRHSLAAKGVKTNPMYLKSKRDSFDELVMRGLDDKNQSNPLKEASMAYVNRYLPKEEKNRQISELATSPGVSSSDKSVMKNMLKYTEDGSMADWTPDEIKDIKEVRDEEFIFKGLPKGVAYRVVNKKTGKVADVDEGDVLDLDSELGKELRKADVDKIAKDKEFFSTKDKEFFLTNVISSGKKKWGNSDPVFKNPDAKKVQEVAEAGVIWTAWADPVFKNPDAKKVQELWEAGVIWTASDNPPSFADSKADAMKVLKNKGKDWQSDVGVVGRDGEKSALVKKFGDVYYFDYGT